MRVIRFLWFLVFVGSTCCAPLDTTAEDQELNDPIASPLEQAGGYFQGDIILTAAQEDTLKTGKTSLIGATYRWPSNTVYYTIDTNAFTLFQLNSIKSALQQIMLISCVKFVERTTQTDYVKVTGQYTGCWSHLGRRGGMQNVNLQPNGCMSRGTIMHEFLHTLGFVHMQSASDRDFYVQINWSAIQAGKESNFDRYSSAIIDDFGVPYDYDSVMHYGATAFSTSSAATIIPYESGVTIGQRVGMSYKDIKRLNLLYPDCG
ncbi:zinc metalloproteinase nas-13-like isoform X2 [Wyeomyia smithii]|nr:zinc metalloproteinase nas-13-like isoform X2 [Wyeomyia smithii]XP_055534237.1 zinc metalloproteinase nas-13-like isoform X2 [Wyeomyia smithii]